MRVVLVTYGFHLQHVFAANALVTTLVEEDAGVVAVVDDGIAHEGCALLPACALDVLLGIAGGHGLRKADTVTRLHILFPRRHVHPAHHVATAFHHQGIAIVTQPRRNTQSHTRPLVGGTLGIAMNHHHAIVEPYLSLAEARLAETRYRGNGIGLLHTDSLQTSPRGGFRG